MPLKTVRTLNLTLEPKLIEEIKIQAVREGRAVSEIVRELFREYLDEKKKEAKAKGKTKD